MPDKKFFISAAGSSKSIRMDHVYSVTKQDLPTQVADARDLKRKYRYLSDVPIRNVKNTKPRLLILLLNKTQILGIRNQKNVEIEINKINLVCKEHRKTET